MLPSYEEIQKWTDKKLLSVIKSGEAINWNCGINETQKEIDDYVEMVYTVKDSRKI